MSDISKYERPALACDCALFRIDDNRPDDLPHLQVRLVRRQWDPDEGKLALIGAFVPVDDRIEDVMRRTLETKGGYSDNISFEQLHTFDTPGRDERWRVVSVAHWGAVVSGQTPNVEVNEADWYDVSPDKQSLVASTGEIIQMSDLAFDHGEILFFALNCLSADIRSTGMALRFLPDEFYIADIGRVVSAISGRTENNVQRKFSKFIEPVAQSEDNETAGSRGSESNSDNATGKMTGSDSGDQARKRPAHRPPVLYRRKAQSE